MVKKRTDCFVQDVAEKVEALIKDKELRGKIGSFNKDRVSKRFDIKFIAKDLVDISADDFRRDCL